MNNIIRFNRKKLPKLSVKPVSISFLEKKMLEHYESMMEEDFEKTIFLAERIIDLDKTNKQAYLTAAMACCYIDDQITATEFLDDMLKVYPSDINALALKMEIHDILYTITKNEQHFIKAIDASSKMLEISPESFSRLISPIQKMKTLYPKSKCTEDIIKGTYESLPNSRLKRQYRNVMDMPDLHINNVIKIY
ncbi:MAG: hypothetical protein U9R34_08680 [Nanoarchaeota archaeon]|nr:hypothetical protein [Nanoarchaeota archaeon]